MHWIAVSSLQSRFLVLALAVMAMAFGAYQFRHMPVDAVPEFRAVQIEVQTEALGLSAAEVEDLVTLNLEDLIAGTSWLERIESTSVPGLSSIVLTFEPGTDLYRARQMVQERLTVAYALPQVAKPPVMLQPLSVANRAMLVGLSSDEVSPIDMSVLAQWTIRPKLMGVSGVANVSIWGQRRRQLHVLVDPEQLRDEGVTLEQVIKTAGDALWVSPLTFLEASFPGSGGWIDGPNQRLEIRHVLPISTPDDLAAVKVDRSELTLGEVADVVEAHPPLIGDAIVNDGPGLLLVVEKLPNASAREVVRGIEAALAELSLGLPGIEIDTGIYRSSDFVDESFANVERALIVGAILVVLVFLIGSFSWRTTLVAAIVIPLSLAISVVVLSLWGTALNAMVLTGLSAALVLLIDDACADTESIVRRIREYRRAASRKATASIIVEASLRARRGLFFGLLVVVLAILPVLFLSGMTGRFVAPLAVSYLLALLASTVVALTVTPVLALTLFRNASPAHLESPLLRPLARGYAAALAGSIRAPVSTAVVAATIAVAGFVSWPLLNLSLVPEFKQRDLLISTGAATGTSHPEMIRIMTLLSSDLRSIPGVANLGAHVGRAVTGDQIVNVDESQLWLRIDPNADYARTRAAVVDTVAGYPGIDGQVKTYLGEIVEQVLAGPGDVITVRVYGPEDEKLVLEAERVRQALAEIDGVAAADLEIERTGPQLEIQVDLDAAGRVGLKPGDIRRAAGTMLAGLQVGALFEQQKVFDVVVWGDRNTRDSLTEIRDLLIDTPNGGHVRLADVASVDIAGGKSTILRDGVSRRIDVAAVVAGRDMDSVVRGVGDALARIDFPLEYHPVLLGAHAERHDMGSRLVSIAVAAAIGIVLLLQACFGSWRMAIAATLTMVGAAAGGLFAVIATGGTLYLGSLVGLIAVLAVSARQSILLVSHCRHLQRDENWPDGRALAERGAQDRLSPMLISAVAGSLLMVPLILYGDSAGLEVLSPMAVAIVGGVFWSTVLSLFLTPALFAAFGARGSPDIDEESTLVVGSKANA
ncbi:MAG: efflux RND transporter permease subunit [Alphaproteobacteria bacterium]|nr:efflux RND transporter permease subunit [Alphaproteobacteria bacterium]